MRLLPRTPRGTWLSAAAIWLAGCAVIWFVLPARPRVVIPEAGPCRGFSTDGRLAFGRAWGTCRPYPKYTPRLAGSPRPDGPYRVWDVRTGTCLASQTVSYGSIYNFAPDGLTAVLMLGGNEQRAELIDLITGRREDLPHSAFTGKVRFTEDGRFLLFEVGYWDPDPVTIWWDRATRQIVGRCPGLVPVAVAPESHWLTKEPAGVDDWPASLVIRAPISGRELARLPRARRTHAEFSTDGSYLLLHTEETTDVIETATGRECARLTWTSAVMIPPGSHVSVAVVERDGEMWLERRDLWTGLPLLRMSLSEMIPATPSPIVYPVPHRDWILFQYATSKQSLVDQLLAHVPLISQFLPSGRSEFLLLDATTGRELSRFRHHSWDVVDVSPDGGTLQFAEDEIGSLTFWDLPPRKPLSWFAIAALVWSLPLMWLARRRIRTLASGVA